MRFAIVLSALTLSLYADNYLFPTLKLSPSIGVSSNDGQSVFAASDQPSQDQRQDDRQEKGESFFVSDSADSHYTGYQEKVGRYELEYRRRVQEVRSAFYKRMNKY
ncbi:MAG: hypothetical protein LBP89_08970 [Helicobacteraceae bacterium]|jgi:hypothetical protein|nr:hypothetical protein [Helicobacteraceae bacterium]